MAKTFPVSKILAMGSGFWMKPPNFCKHLFLQAKIMAHSWYIFSPMGATLQPKAATKNIRFFCRAFWIQKYPLLNTHNNKHILYLFSCKSYNSTFP